jgi:murein DD-endopeptidase MepM/ murein hydrolase activator NlpD
MPRRNPILFSDRPSGALRHLHLRLRSILWLAGLIVTLPVAIGFGAKWNSVTEVERLRAAKLQLETENTSYRAATGELTTQIQSLENVINDLGARSALDPAQVRAMQKLPAVVRARASGGTTTQNLAMSALANAPISSPEDTFGVLRMLLQSLENRLTNVKQDVEKREELAAATPSIWPAHGWLTGGFGGRSDPFTGLPGFHQGIDISTDKGDPVYATADATVVTAGWTGDYGNLVVLRHAFGLVTRYGHLSKFIVSIGQNVKRGDVIGYVGATGRATGSHLHYEIFANGKLINPLQLLTQQPTRR